MAPPRLTVGEVFRSGQKEYLSRYRSTTPAYQQRALAAISLCQTPLLGATLTECSQCQHRELHYQSCYHRGCPTCEGSKDALWMKARVDELLPVHYFHVVFTVPHLLNEFFLKNQKVYFSRFFDAVKETLMTIGKNHLNAEIGFFAVLHTWGQKLNFHPHIHCVVPGGGLSFDRTRWVSSSKKKHYFASHKVLALVFQGILIKKIKRAQAKEKLVSHDLEKLLTDSVQKKWVVHCKPPFDSALRVIQYLSRYTRKVAISNSQLISLKNNSVSFSWKDYKNDAQSKVTILDSVEFIRRFLTHIPLPRFIRIRHFGFLSNAKRKTAIPLISELIGELLPDAKALQFEDSFQPGRCPVCKVGFMTIISPLKKVPTLCNSS